MRVAEGLLPMGSTCVTCAWGLNVVCSEPLHRVQSDEKVRSWRCVIGPFSVGNTPARLPKPGSQTTHPYDIPAKIAT